MGEDPAMTATAAPTARRGVVHNTVDIAVDPQTVFDYVTDIAHETAWNPKLRQVLKLTDGPIGQGTRFRLRLSGTGWMTTEIVAFHRPSFWATIGESRRLSVQSEAEVAGTGQGSRLIVRTLLAPHGLLRLAKPALRAMIRRHWDDNLRTIKNILESTSSSRDIAPTR
jgi:uncharacterized protein YndB with AHSA1/START domain